MATHWSLDRRFHHAVGCRFCCGRVAVLGGRLPTLGALLGRDEWRRAVSTLNFTVRSDGMADLMRPDDLKKISNDADMAKAQEYLRRAKKQEE